MTNVANLLASGVEPNLLDTVRAIADAAEECGSEPYLVGGLVRDLIIGAGASPDLDIALVGATANTFDGIAQRVSGQIVKRSQFNTVAMKVGIWRFDIIMARSESYPTPGSLPAVQPGSIEEDLARRDFSVNAMAVSLSASDWGELRDPHNGLADLRDGVLRALYPGSFRDDATRILRAARYASRLSLQLSEDTEDALIHSTRFLANISSARTRNELERALLERNASGALALLYKWGALTAIHPALKFEPTAWKLFDERADSLSQREQVAVGYAIFGRGVSKTESDAIFSRLKPGSAERRALEESAFLVGIISDGALVGLSNSELSNMLDPLSESAILGCSLAMAADTSVERLDEYLRCLKTIRPELSGNDIIALGVERGPDVGKTLKQLRAARQDRLIGSRSEEEAFVHARLKASQDS